MSLYYYFMDKDGEEIASISYHTWMVEDTSKYAVYNDKLRDVMMDIKGKPNGVECGYGEGQSIPIKELRNALGRLQDIDVPDRSAVQTRKHLIIEVIHEVITYMERNKMSNVDLEFW